MHFLAWRILTLLRRRLRCREFSAECYYGYCVESGLGLQARLHAEQVEFLESFDRIDPRGPADFRQALRAQRDRARVGFFAMVRPAHVALVCDAVEHREHVAGLVGGGLQRSEQEELERFGSFVGEPVAMDRPDADTLAERGLAEDEIPALLCPQTRGPRLYFPDIP